MNKELRTAIKELKDNGFVLARNGANHDVYMNPKTGRIIPLKRHDFDKSDLRYIRKEIGL